LLRNVIFDISWPVTSVLKCLSTIVIS